MADEQDRLSLVVGEAGHQRVVVGEPAIAVDLGEAGEQPLDEVLDAGTIRMARDEDALPGRQRLVQLAAHRLETTVERFDLAIACVGPRQLRQRLDLLQDDRDRLFEVECFRNPNSANAKNRRRAERIAERNLLLCRLRVLGG